MPRSTADTSSSGSAPSASAEVKELPSPRGSGLHLDGDRGAVLLAGDHAVVLLRVGHRRADRLPVGDLRLSHARLHLELAEDPGHQDVQVQLSHARDDELTGLHVLLHGEGRILQREHVQDLLELLALGEGLRLDGHRDDRLGEMHLFQEDGEGLHAEGVAGPGALQPDHDGDVPRLHVVDLLGVVGVHPQEPVHPLALLLGDVEDRLAFLDPCPSTCARSRGCPPPGWPGA